MYRRHKRARIGPAGEAANDAADGLDRGAFPQGYVTARRYSSTARRDRPAGARRRPRRDPTGETRPSSPTPVGPQRAAPSSRRSIASRPPPGWGSYLRAGGSAVDAATNTVLGGSCRWPAGSAENIIAAVWDAAERPAALKGSGRSIRRRNAARRPGWSGCPAPGGHRRPPGAVLLGDAHRAGHFLPGRGPPRPAEIKDPSVGRLRGRRTPRRLARDARPGRGWSRVYRPHRRPSGRPARAGATRARGDPTIGSPRHGWVEFYDGRRSPNARRGQLAAAGSPIRLGGALVSLDVDRADRHRLPRRPGDEPPAPPPFVPPEMLDGLERFEPPRPPSSPMAPAPSLRWTQASGSRPRSWRSPSRDARLTDPDAGTARAAAGRATSRGNDPSRAGPLRPPAGAQGRRLAAASSTTSMIESNYMGFGWADPATRDSLPEPRLVLQPGPAHAERPRRSKRTSTRLCPFFPPTVSPPQVVAEWAAQPPPRSVSALVRWVEHRDRRRALAGLSRAAGARFDPPTRSSRATLPPGLLEGLAAMGHPDADRAVRARLGRPLQHDGTRRRRAGRTAPSPPPPDPRSAASPATCAERRAARREAASISRCRWLLRSPPLPPASPIEPAEGIRVVQRRPEYPYTSESRGRARDAPRWPPARGWPGRWPRTTPKNTGGGSGSAQRRVPAAVRTMRHGSAPTSS